jgi:hypothetical protein
VRDHDHPELAATGDEFPEHIAVAEESAAVVERHLGGVVGNASARAEADGVGVDSFEVIEPELGIEFAGIVFDQGQLRPTHRFVDPGWVGRRLRPRASQP